MVSEIPTATKEDLLTKLETKQINCLTNATFMFIMMPRNN